jgi:hypothetical protein
MQDTTPVSLRISAVNCKFLYGNYYYVWEDNISLDFRDVGCGVVDWIELVQGSDKWRALGTAVLNLLFYKMRGIS